MTAGGVVLCVCVCWVFLGNCGGGYYIQSGRGGGSVVVVVVLFGLFVLLEDAMCNVSVGVDDGMDRYLYNIYIYAQWSTV